MTALCSRLTHSGKNWRHVYKSLKVVENLIQDGNEMFLNDCCSRISIFSSLKDFTYVDNSNCDQGLLVCNKAVEICMLLTEFRRASQVSIYCTLTVTAFSALNH
jgi:epsin